MDPFGSDDEEILDQLEPEFYDEENNAIKAEGKMEEDEDKTSKKTSSIRVMATPMGIIPITENTSSSKIFNFWMGHTNFSITHRVAEIIEESEGVEALDVFTRYRFRIAIGKAFTDSSVMKNINDSVYEHLG